MSLLVSKSQLATQAKELSRNWEYTKQHWQDSKSAEFEVKYLQPLQTQMVATLEALEKLDRAIHKIRSDCE